MLNPQSIDWEKMEGLVPAIVQDAFDGRVLMQAYMNLEAVEKTIASGNVTFWSRSRNCLWTKGETSGNNLELVEMHGDCDNDCILVLARPSGPACHRGTATCFDNERAVSPSLSILAQLERVITGRDEQRPGGSYTTKLFESGTRRIAQKVGEEGVETALAGVSGDSAELVDEAADLVYHLLVLLRERDVSLARVIGKLSERHHP